MDVSQPFSVTPQILPFFTVDSRLTTSLFEGLPRIYLFNSGLAVSPELAFDCWSKHDSDYAFR